MYITIRKLEEKTHEYFAYLKAPTGKAVYLLYFSDDIYGAINLNNFLEMIKNHFKVKRIEIRISEEEVRIKNQLIKAVLFEGDKA